MAVTLETLIQDVKSRLGESNITRAAQLDSGLDSTPAIAGDVVITAYLNEALFDLARWSWPIPGNASATLAAASARIPFDALLDIAGRRIHAANAVAFGAASLSESSKAIVRRWQETQFQAAGTPYYWFVDGDGVGFDKAPTADATITVNGFVLPVPMVSTTDTVDSLPDDLTPLLVFRAAAMVAAKNAEDPSLGPRVSEWLAAYSNGAAAVKARAMARDPETAVLFFAGSVQPIA